MFFPNLGLLATTNVITAGIDETVQSALQKMHEHNHRSIVVVDGPQHYILTSKDIIRLKLEQTDFDTPLFRVILRPLPMIQRDSNIVDALSLTNEHDEHICVCNEDGTLYGLVTNSDIIGSVDPQIVLDSLQIGTLLDKKYGYKSFSPNTPMDEVLHYLKDAPNDCVIIQEGSIPIGILTSKDVLRLIEKNGLDTIPVAQEMSAPIMTLDSKSSINEGLEFLKRRHFKRIVVTDQSGSVIGVVTQQDLISRTYLKWSQLMRDHFKQFEELTHVLQQKNRHLAELATKDSLTDIHNRHMFTELFTNELAVLKREETKLSLMMIDLDHFKQINDTYGHNIGDVVLKAFTQTVAASIREADIFARWGGEEFVLLLRGVSSAEAYEIGEKIRRVVETQDFNDVGHITCSIGTAEVLGTDSIESAVHRADRALYTAKERGRNQTVIGEA